MDLVKKLALGTTIGIGLLSGTETLHSQDLEDEKSSVITNSSYQTGAITIYPGINIHKETAHFIDRSEFGNGDGHVDLEEVNKFKKGSRRKKIAYMIAYAENDFGGLSNAVSDFIPASLISDLAHENAVSRIKSDSNAKKVLKLDYGYFFTNETHAKTILEKIYKEDDYFQKPYLLYIDVKRARRNIKYPVEIIKAVKSSGKYDYDAKEREYLDIPVLDGDLPTEEIVLATRVNVTEGCQRKNILVQDTNEEGKENIYAISLSRFLEFGLVAKSEDNIYTLDTNPRTNTKRPNLRKHEPRHFTQVGVFPSELVKDKDRYYRVKNITDLGILYWNDEMGMWRSHHGKLNIDYDPERIEKMPMVSFDSYKIDDFQLDCLYDHQY